MSSFDDVFAVPPPPERPVPEELRPVWAGPPVDELGTAVPVGVVLGRSDRAAVGLRSLTAYSSGATFELLALARGLPRSEANRVMHEQHHLGGDGNDVSPLVLRIGITFADGRRASNTGFRHPPFSVEPRPEEPVLFPAGGGGGMSSDTEVSLHPGYWLWPLPPGDELRLACEWPGLGIAFTEHTLDAAEIRAAALRSHPLW